MRYPGLDFSTFREDPTTGRVARGSMDLSFVPIGGDGASQESKARVCLETILRKLQCQPGSMDDEQWGVDLRGYLNASMTSHDLAQIGAVARLEILKEEYVAGCDVVCLLSTDGLLIVDVSVDLGDLGSYTMAFSLNATGIVRILGVGGNAD